MIMKSVTSLISVEYIKFFIVLNVTIFVGIFSIVSYRVLTSHTIPKVDRNHYWGPGQPPSKVDTSIREFKINISENEVADLKWRLSHLRPLVPPLEGIQQQYGMNTNLLRDIVEFWKTKYDWRERETYLNQFPQFKTNIQGLDLHYIHVKPKNPGKKKILPLLILHGWPGSVREFYDVIPIFTTPSDDRNFVFEVIVPHIPGYGFSQAAAKPGLGATQVAVIMNNLMERLGHKKYYCQGGDFGAITLQSLAVLYPENVLGYHTNMAIINTPLSFIIYGLGSIFSSWVIKPEHYSRIYPIWELIQLKLKESGYLLMQATKPDTIGVGATDSPAGLAAYILEKFTTGTNNYWQDREDGGLLEKFTYTDLLDNIMIYWFSGSAASAFRLYSETFNKKELELAILWNPLKVPTAIARFQFDFYVADGIIKEIFPNNLQLSDLKGGHFAALEEPKLFSDDVFSAVEKFEEYNMNIKIVQKNLK